MSVLWGEMRNKYVDQAASKARQKTKTENGFARCCYYLSVAVVGWWLILYVAAAAREAGHTAPRTDADFKTWIRQTAQKVPARGQAMLQAVLDWRAGKLGTEELTEMFIKIVG